MNQSKRTAEPEARYISVNDLEYKLADGFARTFRKHLLTTEGLEIHQTLIKGRGAAEDYGVSATSRAAYVLAGTAALNHVDQAPSGTEIGKGHLIVVPPGAQWGGRLSVRSDELVLLEIAPTLERQNAPAFSRSEIAAPVHAVNPRELKSYEPAGHAKTRNRCLFVDEHMEIIEGLIDRGGGAEKHSHRNHEQILYVLRGLGLPLLIHYPKGAPHGTGGGVSEPLELLVIYSPPLRESQNALA